MKQTWVVLWQYLFRPACLLQRPKKSVKQVTSFELPKISKIDVLWKSTGTLWPLVKQHLHAAFTWSLEVASSALITGTELPGRNQLPSVVLPLGVRQNRPAESILMMTLLLRSKSLPWKSPISTWRKVGWPHTRSLLVANLQTPLTNAVYYA